MKFSFHSVPIFDIDGLPVEGADIHKTLAQVLYRQCKSLDLVEKAMAMNKGEEVDLEKVEIEEVVGLINSPLAAFHSFAKKALLDYIEAVKKEKPIPSEE